MKYRIIGYFRYVDDILIIYRNETTIMHDVLTVFIIMTSTMKFTMEEENDSKTNFLNITISKED